MKRQGWNSPKPKKYRPTKGEQGLYSVRQVGEPVPVLTIEQTQAQDLAAKIWGASASLKRSLIKEPKGIQKRNLRLSDCGKKSRQAQDLAMLNQRVT